jgi:ABC-type nitrate/sulfonate/bicarbonate transport system substrate-binding protein
MSTFTPKTASNIASRTPLRLAAATTVGIIALGLTACSTGDPAALSDGGDLTHVTFALSYLPDPSLSGLAYALENDLFTEQGLEVEILPWGSTTPEQLVSSGQADFGSATDIRTALLAIAAGAEMTSLMATYEHVPYVLTALADNGIESPKDLAGKTYGGFGSPMEIAVVNDMIAADGGTEDAEAVALSVAAFDALTSGRVETVLSFPGEIFQMSEAGADLLTWDTRDYGLPDGYAGLIMSADSYITENPETVQGFVTAMQAGYAAVLADPEAGNEALLNLYPDELDPAVVEYVSQVQTEELFVSADGIVGSQEAEIWQANADWLIDEGILVDGSGALLTSFDTADLFTNDYLAR